MLKKYMKYIILIIALFLITNFKVEASANKIDMHVSQVKSNYCKYEYDGITINVYETQNNKITVKTTGKSISYDSYNSEFLKNKSLSNARTCPKIYAYVYTMGAPVGEIAASEKKVLYFYFSPSDVIEIFNSSYENTSVLNGNLKRITTSCIYKAENSEFSAVYNLENRKFTFPVRGVYKLRKSAKKNWEFNESQGGIKCKDNIIIDICSDGSYVRTVNDSMTKTCSKSTNPEGYTETIIKGESDGTDIDIKYLSNICTESRSTVLVIRVIGYVLLIAKILVPIALIIFGTISFAQTVISGSADDTKKTAMGLMWKFIAAIVIFVLPTIINFAIGLIDGATDGVDDYENCRNCIFDPNDCKIPVEEGE